MKLKIILGPPGSGKGTQTQYLQDKMNKIISAGNLLREKFQIGTPERTHLDNGGIIEPDLVNELIKEEILRNNFDIMLDGYPRTIIQAEFIMKLLAEYNKKIDYIFVLFSEKEHLEKRIQSRFICGSCNLVYDENIICCSPTIRRNDDIDLAILHKRITVYTSNIDEILKILSGPIYFIDANLSKLEVKSKIFSILGF